MTMVLTLSDCAEQLRLSRRAVDRLTATGRLPTVVIGAGSVRVRQEDLDRFVSGLEVRTRAPADAEERAEHASLGVEQASYQERQRLESIVCEMTEAHEHRGDAGQLRVVWQRDGHDVALERRFAGRAEADAFAASVAANQEAGPLVRLDVDDGQGMSPIGDNAAAVRRAELSRRRH